MQREYYALIKNGTWRLVDPPIGTKPIGCKWIYKNKYKEYDSLDKHKARLLAKGYAQKEGVDYTKTFALTAKWGTIRTLFSLAAQKGWKIHHMDVKTTLFEWRLKRRCVYGSASRLCYQRSRTEGMQISQIFIWFKASTPSLV